MQTLNHLYSSKERFLSFLLNNNIDKNNKPFIQIFTAHNDPAAMQSLLDVVYEFLPHACVIATTTAGEIVEGGMTNNTTVISLTTFEATQVTVALIEGKNEKELAKKIKSKLIKEESKLIVLFNNLYVNDGQELMSALEKSLPESVMIAGGNAGDNNIFTGKTLVGAGREVSTTGVAVAVFNSSRLQVFNDHLFNWQTIGESMTITKADKSTIYEINHQKAQEVYEKFLGDEVAQSLPASGTEFPLIFHENGLDIARAPVAVGEQGELIMAGHLKEGDRVKFGFGDVGKNEKQVLRSIKAFATLPVESIFIYTCSARKYFLQDQLNYEFELLQKIAPTSGFVTYGEFYQHNRSNKMLNVTSTFIGLSENSHIKHDIEFQAKFSSAQTRTLNALTHLVKQTSKHLEEKNLSLDQFQNIIKASTLYSATDTKGIITDVNERFTSLSGYTREELIGKPHNIVRHKDMPAFVYKEMWDTIKAKKTWKGIIKNRAKDGSAYYVRSHVFPILGSHGNISHYISLRDDITEEIEKQERLEGSVTALEERSNEKEYLLKQYEKIINLSSSFLRIDPDFRLVYVNDVFCDTYNCKAEELKTMNISEIINADFREANFFKIVELLKEEESWSGVVPFEREDKSILHMNTTVNTIYDKDKNIVEYMVALNDITELINTQQEIIETQKDVVYTMGAIGETRSKETGNHVKRVAEYSKVLALHYGLDIKQAELLKTASPMHDIGKVGIPDAILNKPGKLTDEEFKIMKTHSALGYQMLKNSKREILKTAAIVAYTHHEKWDGSGYPKGIKGEAIDIFGRITALADVFDALGSDRCYKKAWEDEKIFELIKNERGKHFDPRLVDIFFEQLDTFLEIRETFKD